MADLDYEISNKSVVLEHTIIILLFLFVGVVLLLPAAFFKISDLLNTILISLSTSLFVAALLTVTYDVILTKDTGRLIASYLILNKQCVNEILDPNKYNEIVKMVLQNYLGN